MTNQQHPITPPPELVREWREEPEFSALSPCSIVSLTTTKLHDIATRAAQWGADQELEACCEWVEQNEWEIPESLRIARRPRSLSLKELALEEVQMACNTRDISMVNFDTIRRALEQLND